MLPWVTLTNVCHQIVCHISPYLNDPKGTGSISDLSTSDGELGNKLLRESLRAKMFHVQKCFNLSLKSILSFSLKPKFYFEF